MKAKATIIIAALSGLLVGVALGAAYFTFIVPNIANIIGATNLVVYVDGEVWTNNTLLDWGDCRLGEAYYVNLTVVNTGATTPLVYITYTNLPFNTTLVWDANATILAPTEIAQGDLTFTVGMEAPLDVTPTWYWCVDAE